MSNKDITEYLDIHGAIEAILEGKKITKIEWNNRGTYFLLKSDILQIHKAGESSETLHPFVLNNGDLSGDDFIII